MAEDSNELRIKQLISGHTEIGRFPFPGDEEFEVGVRVLSDDQMDQCQLRAYDYVRTWCQRRGYVVSEFIDVTPDFLDIELTRQILLLAIVHADSEPTKPKPFFESDEAVRKLPTVVRQQLYEEYLDYQDALNTRRGLTQDQVLEIVETIKKEPSAKGYLARLAPGTLRALLRTLASQWPSSPTGKSSTSEAS